ncbi:MAG: nuclear transport factor 2 family protein [Proteobacteria bacterium]|nr:nuclear transport factor 2 family protein [Pseudomonadota bacterium]
MHLRAISAALVLACAWAPAAAHEPAKPAAPWPAALTGEAAQAAGVVDGFHQALDRGDTAAALSALAEDALIFESGGVERGRAEYASHHLAADAAFAQAVPSTRVRRTGRVEGDLAWIASEGRTTGTWKGKALNRVITETVLLRRRGAGWVIVHIHWSSGASPEG